MKHVSGWVKTTVLSVACLATLQTHAQNTQADKAPAVMRRPEPALKIGDPAPPLIAAKWIKGTPVTQFEPGRIYVVEFWATWCGPCRANMPHLSEIARKYKDKATVLSFDVMELIAAKDKNADYVAKVERFVKRLGDGMDYTVAADTREGDMNNAWMKAAGLGGIPTAFVVDQQGKIAWIGHPMMLDEVVGMVIDGTLDEAGRKQLAQQMRERREKTTALNTQMEEAEKAGDIKTALKITDEILSVSPTSKGAMFRKKYELMSRVDPAGARKYAEEGMKKFANDPLTLQSVAMFIIDSKEESGKKPDYALALKMMQQAAARCDSEDPFTTSNLAKAFYMSGDIKNALKTQQKVIDLLNDESLVTQKQTVKDEAQKNMEAYKSRNSPTQSTNL